MAQRVRTELIDDLNGEPASSTVRFGLQGAEYEIDLTEENETRLRELLDPFVKHGRRQRKAKL